MAHIPLSAGHAEPEGDEIARLRKTADELRADLAGKRKTVSAKPAQTAPPAAGPVLLAPGRAVGIEHLTYAGNDTPEAAAQSLLVARRNGDFDQLARLLLISPNNVQEWNEMLALPEARDQAREKLSEDLQGRPTIELLSSKALDAHRTILTFRIASDRGSRTNRETYGNTGSGWKELF
jgi:hypothetical protein